MLSVAAASLTTANSAGHKQGKRYEQDQHIQVLCEQSSFRLLGFMFGIKASSAYDNLPISTHLR